MNGKKRSGLLLSALALALMLLLFCIWLRHFAREDRARQREALEKALQRNVLLCYTLEGHYPDTLEELLEKYPLTYDQEVFVIDYRLQGGNILPEIVILEIS